MGMRPVGLVQGFCVMRWAWYTRGSQYSSSMFWSGNSRRLSSYGCPHYLNYGYNQPGAEHRTWGANVEQTWVSDAWATGYNSAFRRMLEEAQQVGAHGVVGIVDTSSHLVDESIREFHVYGTAVVVEGAERPGAVWTSYPAGERLAKLVEAGFFPVSVVAGMASIRVWASCTTEILLHGRNDMYGVVSPTDEISQISDSEMQARWVARDRLKPGLGSDLLQGATFSDSSEEIGAGEFERTCVLRGTRMRRFSDAEPLPAPIPTVVLR
jgi:putative heavy-metal-binding protein